MLDELGHLFAAMPDGAPRDDYVRAIKERNVTDKKTAATRTHTIQRLSELYGLDPGIPIFRVFRRLWAADPVGQPLLALLCGLARDPLFRLTLPVILSLRPGDELSRRAMATSIQNGVGDRLNPDSVDKVVRNASSSWTQSGHLTGRMRKIRQRVSPTPIVATFALLLGYLEGARGAALLRTSWAQLLDTLPEHLTHLAGDAKRLGLLDMKHAGDVVEFGFAPLDVRDNYGKH